MNAVWEVRLDRTGDDCSDVLSYTRFHDAIDVYNSFTIEDRDIYEGKWLMLWRFDDGIQEVVLHEAF